MEVDVNEIKKSFDKLDVHRKYIVVIASIITIFICLLLFQQCQHTKSENDLLTRTANYSDSAKSYKGKYNEVVFNQSLAFNNAQQLKNYFLGNDTLKDLLKKFKNINSLTIIKEKVYIHDTVAIQFENRIPCDFKPFKVKRDCTYYHFAGTIYPTKFTIDSIIIPNKQNIVVGRKKIHLFKYEYRVEITNTNPHIITTNVGGYVINVKKKWYQRPLPMFLGGAIAGAAAYSFIKN